MLLSRSRNMRGNSRVEEDLDEYEDDFVVSADEYEDEDEEEEDEAPEDEPLSEEAMKYLDLRQKLKERMRCKLRKENGVRANNSKDQLRTAPLEKFGSFFGPSKPVIADRVIQESKSLLETRHLAAKASTSQNDQGKKVAMPSRSGTKSGTKNGVIMKRPAPMLKSKAQLIKDTRDYAFLLSDDAELPKSSKDPGPSKSSAAKPDSRSAQVPTKSSQPSSYSAGKRINEYEQRRPNSGVPNARPAQAAAPQKLTSGINRSHVSSDSKRQGDLRKQPQTNKQLASSNGNGSSRPTGHVRPSAPKVLPPKRPMSSGDKRVSTGSMEKRTPIGSMEKRVPVSSLEKRAPTASVGNRAPTASAGNRTPTVSAGNRAPTASTRYSTPNGQRMPIVKSQDSGVNNRMGHRPNVQRSSDGRILKRENMVDSRNQMVRPHKQDPYRANSQRDAYVTKKPKPAGQSSLQRSGPSSNRKRRADDAFSDEEGFDFRSEIRKMFGRPTRDYDDDEDEDDCMEVGFNTILQEEKRSARIAKKEDDDELIKIMEEEKQERLRKQAKMRKMSQR